MLAKGKGRFEALMLKIGRTVREELVGTWGQRDNQGIDLDI